MKTVRMFVLKWRLKWRVFSCTCRHWSIVAGIQWTKRSARCASRFVVSNRVLQHSLYTTTNKMAEWAQLCWDRRWDTRAHLSRKTNNTKSNFLKKTSAVPINKWWVQTSVAITIDWNLFLTASAPAVVWRAVFESLADYRLEVLNNSVCM